MPVQRVAVIVALRGVIECLAAIERKEAVQRHARARIDIAFTASRHEVGLPRPVIEASAECGMDDREPGDDKTECCAGDEHSQHAQRSTHDKPAVVPPGYITRKVVRMGVSARDGWRGTCGEQMLDRQGSRALSRFSSRKKHVSKMF